MQGTDEEALSKRSGIAMHSAGMRASYSFKQMQAFQLAVMGASTFEQLPQQYQEMLIRTEHSGPVTLASTKQESDDGSLCTVIMEASNMIDTSLDAIATTGHCASSIAKEDGSLSTPVQEHMMGKHDQKTHGNKYGTDDKGNKVLVYKGGSGGKAGTKKIYKSIASFKDAMSGKTPEEKEAFLLANGGNAWIKSLTAGQRSALSTYTGHSYHQINESIGEALRKNTPLDKVKQSIVDRATQALLNNKIPESITVTRGVHGISHLFEVGKAFTDKGFMSTSVGSGFSGFKLTIQLPKGSPGGYISPLSQYGHEKEFLLPPGARFQVLSKDASGAVLHYIGQS